MFYRDIKPSSQYTSKFKRVMRGYADAFWAVADPITATYSFVRKEPRGYGGAGLANVIEDYKHTLLPDEHPNETTTSYKIGTLIGASIGVGVTISTMGASIPFFTGMSTLVEKVHKIIDRKALETSEQKQLPSAD